MERGGEPTRSDPISRPCEHGREISFVLTVGLVDVADPNVGVVGVEQIVAVRGAIHPPIKGRLWRGAAAGENVLAHPRPGVALREHAITDARTIRASMREEVVAGHIGAVAARGRLELTLRVIGSQTLAQSLRIDQGH